MSVTRGRGPAIPDCAFSASPEPIVGVEWHSNRVFSIDLAATYSFVHLTSNEGIVTWVQMFQIFAGRRVSF